MRAEGGRADSVGRRAPQTLGACGLVRKCPLCTGETCLEEETGERREERGRGGGGGSVGGGGGKPEELINQIQ